MKLKKIKFILLVIIVLNIFIIFNSKISAYGATNLNIQYGVTTANVNLRKAPNLDTSTIVFTIPTNTNLEIVASLDNFYIVFLSDGKVGFVSKDYITIKEKQNNFPEFVTLDKYFATANSNSINLRGGPSTNFQIYGKIKNDEKVEVLGKINDFFLVLTKNNTIGMIREDLISKDFNISDEQINEKTLQLLNLINNKRQENGLNQLETLPKLQEVAILKADDMVKNMYFAHESPTYGSPFNMMQNFGITYKTAGENIAGNSTIDGALNSWLESESHKKNILSTEYNYIGIGIAPSQRYGYVIVVMFIGK